MIVAYLVTTYGPLVSERTTGNPGGDVAGVIALDSKAVGACIQIDAEAAVVGGIGSRVGRTNLVAANDGAGLVAERIDAAGVIELTGIVADIVTRDAIVLHTCYEGCPSPTDADARVAEEKHVVLADGAVAYIAQTTKFSLMVSR